jgi:DNA-binding HxlR family transcriptional regulator
MAGKSYDHYCAMARALDVIGERWTLLVVRELLDGPKRYKELMDGLPGIATDMLAARLESLEEENVVARRNLAAGFPVYELTGRGRDLEPLLRELVKWGLPLLNKKSGEKFRAHWLSTPLRMMFRPEHAAGPKLTVQFETGRQEMHIVVENGAMQTFAAAAENPDVVIAGDIATLTLAARDRKAADEARAKGKLQVSGKKDDIKRAMRILGLR